MRLLRRVLMLAIAVMLVYGLLAVVVPVSEVPDHPFFDGPSPWIIAHQGGGGLRPENTLPAFEHARALGADVLEMDVRRTRDGAFVILHDATLDRTTNGTGPVSDLSLEEVRELDAGYRFEDPDGSFPFRAEGVRVPTLLEVLDRFPRARLNLEMKSFDEEDAVGLCEVLRENEASERVLVASFGHEPMVHFRSACPEVATSATMREGLLFYQLNRMHLKGLYRSPALALQVPEREPRAFEPRFLRFAREKNIKVQVWTVNEKTAMERLLELGVQGILTDYPDRLKRVMNSRRSAAER